MGIEMKIIMLEQGRPRHTARFEIVKQRGALSAGECFTFARCQDPQFFKQLARSARDHRGFFGAARVHHSGLDISRIELSAGERVIAAQKGELFTALHPENFRVLWICILTKEYDGSGVFR